MSYSNPVPVAVALVPYNNCLVGIRRGIEPRKGQLAFPLHEEAMKKFYETY